MAVIFNCSRGTYYSEQCKYAQEQIPDLELHVIVIAGHKTASFPGSHAWEEEREPGTHFSCMRQVPLVTCILLRYTKITVTRAWERG